MKSKRYTSTWKRPTGVTAKRPVSGYLLTIQLKGKKRILISKRLNRKTLKYSISRKALLRVTFRTRGEAKRVLTYVVKVRAINSAGTSSAAQRTFKLRP